MVVQYTKTIPEDAAGQKTTAVPITEAGNLEWVTPVHVASSGILIPSDVQSSIGYNSTEDMFKIQSTQKKFRDSFSNASLDLTKWDVIQTGTGQAIAQSAGVLTMTTGTTINAETIIQSKDSFTVPFRAMFGIMLSQRIANQEFYVEMVSVNDAGVADNQFCAAWKLDGVTATQAKYQVQSGGLARLDSAASTIASTASYSIKEIECFSDETWFHDRAMDSPSGRSNSYVRHQQIPDPNRLYKIRVRVKNLGTAPATTTTFSMQYITVIDYAELTTEITASRGAAQAGMALPVQIANTPTVTASVQANNTIGQTSVANLAANATYTATSIDTGSTIQYNTYRIMVAHTAGLTPGSLIYEQSTDNATFRETHRIPIPSDGLYRTFELPVICRYVRVRFVNGATAQTLFFIMTNYSRFSGVYDLDKPLCFLHSTTPLAAAATFTGTTLDLGGNHAINRHRALCYADQAGTLYIEESRDGTTWRATLTQAVTAGGVVEVDSIVVARYQRVRYVNGATLQGAFELQSALVKS